MRPTSKVSMTTRPHHTVVEPRMRSKGHPISKTHSLLTHSVKKTKKTKQVQKPKLSSSKNPLLEFRHGVDKLKTSVKVQKHKSGPSKASLVHHELKNLKTGVHVKRPKSSPSTKPMSSSHHETKKPLKTSAQVPKPKSSPVHAAVIHTIINHISDRISKMHKDSNIQSHHTLHKSTKVQSQTNKVSAESRNAILQELKQINVHQKVHTSDTMPYPMEGGLASLKGRFEQLDTLLSLSMIHKKHAIEVAKYLFRIGKMTSNTGLRMVLAQQNNLAQSKGKADIERAKSSIMVGRRVMNIGMQVLNRAITLLKSAVEENKEIPKSAASAKPRNSETTAKSATAKPRKSFLPKDFRLVVPVVKMVSLCSHSPIHKGLTLRGGFHSGKFYSQGKVKNMQTCIKLCCARENCDLAFMVKSFCYSVSCYKHEMCKSVNAYHVTKYHPQVAYVFKGKKAKENADLELKATTSKPHKSSPHSSIGQVTTKPTKTSTSYSKYIKKLVLKVSEDQVSHSTVSPPVPTEHFNALKEHSSKRIAGSHGGFCPQSHLMHNVGILYGLKAGNYTYFGETSDMKMCIKNCCSQRRCDIALMLDSSCYGVECSVVQTCQITSIHNAKYKSTAVYITRRFNKDKSSELQKQMEQTAKEKLDIENTVNLIENALNLNQSTTHGLSNVDKLLEHKIMLLVDHKDNVHHAGRLVGKESVPEKKPNASQKKGIVTKQEAVRGKGKETNSKEKMKEKIRNNESIIKKKMEGTRRKAYSLNQEKSGRKMEHTPTVHNTVTLKSFSPYIRGRTYFLWNNTSPSPFKSHASTKHQRLSQTASVYSKAKSGRQYSVLPNAFPPSERNVPKMRPALKIENSYYGETPSYEVVGVLPSVKPSLKVKYYNVLKLHQPYISIEMKLNKHHHLMYAK